MSLSTPSVTTTPATPRTEDAAASAPSSAPAGPTSNAVHTPAVDVVAARPTAASKPWREPKEWKNQIAIEIAPDADAKVAEHYGVPTSKGWHNDVTLRPTDSSTQVSIAADATWGLGKKVELVGSIEELLQPGMGEKLKARGYTGDLGPVGMLLAIGAHEAALSAAKSRDLSMKLTMPDNEGTGRIIKSTQPWYKRWWQAVAGGPKPLQRTVQRVSIQLDKDGKVAGAHIHTYAWPERGLRGMNAETINWYPREGAKRYLSNEDLGRSIAVSMGVNLMIENARHAAAKKA